MSEQMTARVDVDLAEGPVLSRRSPLRWIMLVVGLAIALALPWFVYPPVAMDVAAWGLFAMSIDLLLGYTGLLSFGHAAFWGSSAYVTGLVAIHAGVPFPLAILAGTVFAMVIAVPIGYLSVRRTGIYFAMVTLAFAQMIYFVANQWRDLTAARTACRDPAELLRDRAHRDRLLLLLLRRSGVHPHRDVHRLAGGQQPVRSRARGDPRQPGPRAGARVRREPVQDRRLRHLRGPRRAGRRRVRHLARVRVAAGAELDHIRQGRAHHRSRRIGTLWGGPVGAAIVVQLEDWLASSGFEGTGIILGGIFVLIVLLFRHGVWGTGRQVVVWFQRRRRRGPPVLERAVGASSS